MDANKKTIRRISLPAELYERLQAARGSRPWPDFIDELEVKLKLTRDRNPHKFYFDKNLAALGLTRDEVCWLCQTATAQPVELTTTDYLRLALDVAHQEGINIDEAQMQERFDIAGLQAQMKGCPHCHAYQGSRSISSLLDEILPERVYAMFKALYAATKM